MQVVLNIISVENEIGLDGGEMTMLIVKKFGGTSVADKEREKYKMDLGVYYFKYERELEKLKTESRVE